jgi:transglutaminase-like putative cysteine protease
MARQQEEDVMARFVKSTAVIFACMAAILAGLALSAFAATGDIERSFATPGSCPTGLAFDGKSLWLADRKTDSLYKISIKDGVVEAAIAAPGYQVEGLTWDGAYLWVLDIEEKTIQQFDPQTGVSLKIIPAPCDNPQGLAWDGEYLWLADHRADKLYQISTEDGTTIKEFASPSGDPRGLAFDGSYLWVSDRSADMIYMITPDKGEVIVAFPAPGKFARGLAFDGLYLWNADYQSDKLFRLVRKDDDPYVRTEGKKQRLEYTHQFRNYGPDVVTSVDIYLAVPENLPNQELLGEIVYHPAPQEFLTDRWGQKVAHYRTENLPGGGMVNVSMTTEAEIFKTRYFIFPEDVGTLRDIPRDIKQVFLSDESKYATADPFIVKSAKEAVGDEQNAYWVARKIFDYIIERMHYELVGGWNIAPTVLKRGSGSCSEYSFVFIAMSRAAGLPARYAGSVAIRGDDASTDDVFHRWVEVYLPNFGWVPIDPSGGDQDTPAGRAGAIGFLNNRYLITTHGGGASEYLEWTYNSNEKWTTKGKCKVYTEHIGEWSPLETAEPADSMSTSTLAKTTTDSKSKVCEEK